MKTIYLRPQDQFFALVQENQMIAFAVYVAIAILIAHWLAKRIF